MTDTAKAWLLCHPISGFLLITAIACLGAFFVNNQHWTIILDDKEKSNFIFYFWIVISPLFLAQIRESVGGLVFMVIGILCVKAMVILCYFLDSSSEILTYICLSIDTIATLILIAIGIKIGRWTYAHMDEVIPRRAKWRNSKVDIYSLSLRYSINRGLACWFCACNSIAVLLLFIVLR